MHGAYGAEMRELRRLMRLMDEEQRQAIAANPRGVAAADDVSVRAATSLLQLFCSSRFRPLGLPSESAEFHDACATGLRSR